MKKFVKLNNTTHLLGPQRSSPKCGKNSVSPVVGSDIKSTKHLRSSNGLKNTERLGLTEPHQQDGVT